jgi:hypothetical protein
MRVENIENVFVAPENEKVDWFLAGPALYRTTYVIFTFADSSSASWRTGRKKCSTHRDVPVVQTSRQKKTFELTYVSIMHVSRDKETPGKRISFTQD